MKRRPFVWSSDCVQCDTADAVFANRVEGNVPIFRELTESVCPLPLLSRLILPMSLPSWIQHRTTRLMNCLSHRLTANLVNRRFQTNLLKARPHASFERLLETNIVLRIIRKNPYCRICTQSRMYARRINRHRDEPLLARGDFAPTEAFGDRIAADMIVVTKTSSDEEATVLVVRDEHAGFIRAFPLIRKSTENVVGCLLQFIGKHADHGPTIIFKGDCAKELEGACLQLTWVAEPTLPNKWPHNCVLERDIRTQDEVTRAVHLQSGFKIRPGLCHSCSYAAFVLNLKHVLKDSESIRYVSAVGSEFTGRCSLLGEGAKVSDFYPAAIARLASSTSTWA